MSQNKIIILITSNRERGNCQELGIFSSKIVNKLGHNSEIIYLKDYKIEHCDGCMRCMFFNEKCKFTDAFYDLIVKINSAAGLLVFAPTYVLTIPGGVKNLIDRYLLMYKDCGVHNKPAISVGVAALPDWHQFELPLLNILVLCLGFSLLDSFIIYGAGPGEVFLDEVKINRLKNSIEIVCQNKKKEYVSGYYDYCPVDFCNVFEKIGENSFRCPVCLTPIYKEDGKFYFNKTDMEKHRWTKEKIDEHFKNWILKTRDMFKKNLRKIIEKKKYYEKFIYNG